MNERIKLLADKAEQYANEQNDKYGARFKTEYDNKFALLIVQECIKEIGYKSAELLDIDFYPHYQERLKKYFGVEE